MRRAFCLGSLGLLLLATEAGAAVFGGYNAGCFDDGSALPHTGTGYQVIRLSRQRFYGHPSLINYVRSLGQTVARQHLGVLLIGDLAQAGGGRMPDGHRSHQTGLDADILFIQNPQAAQRSLTTAEREALAPVSLLDAAHTQLDSARWQPRYGEILKLAASDQLVTRIFVNPLIKQKLCAEYGGQDWLRKVRPWPGHDGHFHVRLRCPPDNPICRDQADPEPGDGCGADLAWWFNAKAQASKPATPAAPPPVLPEQCRPRTKP